jgi:putative PIN family toxin of toxin-antitoxin system
VESGKIQISHVRAIAREYLDVINRPKFKIPQIEIMTVTEYLLQNAEFVIPEEKIVVIVADPTDNKFLEAAVVGKVNYIVSGDGHLLDLGSFRDIPIITARDFIDLLNQ